MGSISGAFELTPKS